MQFVKIIRKMEILNPLLNFEKDFRVTESREDPLTGLRIRLSSARAGRTRQTETSGSSAREVAAASRQGCFFCPPDVEMKTPKFPEHFFGQERIRRGECLLFPNLFPFSDYHMVATMTHQHFLDLHEFTPRMIADNLTANHECLLLLGRHDSEARYPLWMWNHLPPSAASIIHPHTQLHVEKEPLSELGVLLQKSQEYLSCHGLNYWDDLIHHEKAQGERYIADVGSMAILSSFAPRGNREIMVIFKGICSLGDLDKDLIEQFSQVITRLLGVYHRMGVDSFNLLTYSGPLGENADYFWLNARLISRPTFQPYYSSDAGPIERFFGERVVEALPEDVAAEMRAAFQG